MERVNRLVLDTETFGLKPDNVVFDIAWSIFNSKQAIKERGVLVQETFSPNRLETLPFYGKKKARLYQVLAETFPIRRWEVILHVLSSDIKKFNVKAVYMYNANFDVEAIQRTTEAMGMDEVNPFGEIPVYDLYTAFSTFAGMRKMYRIFCEANGLISTAGNVRTTAESALKFILSTEYEENHTALSDVRDEILILKHLIKRKKAYNLLPVAHPWKLANKKG